MAGYLVYLTSEINEIKKTFENFGLIRRFRPSTFLPLTYLLRDSENFQQTEGVTSQQIVPIDGAKNEGLVRNLRPTNVRLLYHPINYLCTTPVLMVHAYSIFRFCASGLTSVIHFWGKFINNNCSIITSVLLSLPIEFM